MLIFVVGVATAFAISLVFYLRGRLFAVEVTPTILAFILFKAVVEIWCSLYAGYFIFISLYYLATIVRNDARRKTPSDIANYPALAIVYLCCEDLERDCLESLCRTKTKGTLRIIVHDDSQDVVEQEKVDNAVVRFSEEYNVDVVVLRRGNREGGKPGAMNYVLDKIPESFEWVLICDNDSRAMDPAWFTKIACELQDETLACVQFRNSGAIEKSSPGLQKRLRHSIDVFEVFVSPAGRYGWLPFFGHNAVLRLSAVREVGGFQPGEFADDIDMSLRLNLAGYRIEYRKDIAFSESHPDNYQAFRARSYKWAYGCASVLRRWALPILKSNVLKLRQKFFFFIFIGFYYTQILLLAYLAVTYFLMPLLIPEYDFSPIFTVFGGTLVIFLMYLPTLAYFLGNDMLRRWPGFAITVGLVYGSIDFVAARGVIDCFLNKKRTWTPTNTVRSGPLNPFSSWLESAVGFGILAIPFVMLPHLLYLPCSYLFALKFLFIPALYLVYRKDASTVAMVDGRREHFLGNVCVGEI
jgi:cellulose synthase/poly-beta-1,6-N-acetylglucosamine synthase-like glycosyltransferase